MISVIIPAFNRVALLPSTLRSLLDQSVPAGEILVVDDGSTDGTADVAAAFGGIVRVIRQANAGPAAARNRGFAESSGEFIHFFDSDDVALPNKHEVQLRALIHHNADIAYGPWVKGRFTDQGFTAENAILQQHGLPGGDLVKALLTNWSIVPHACLFRRGIVEKAGGFPDDLFVAEDQLMFLNCLLAGARVVHSPGTLELYRSDNPGKITDATQGRDRHIKEWSRFLVKAAERCSAHGCDATTWFGFRQRVWSALFALRVNRIDLPEVEGALEDLLDGGGPWLAYRVAQQVQRKRLGLLHRLGRGRAHPCFKAGRLNGPQELALAQWKGRL
jgi:glycosyltransferase involved in cell wall biosynthesis